MLTKFYSGYRIFRVICIATFAIFAVAEVVKAHSWSLEIEYIGPGSEAERLNEACREKENREAAERYFPDPDNADPRDYEPAWEYERDHGV